MSTRIEEQPDNDWNIKEKDLPGLRARHWRILAHLVPNILDVERKLAGYFPQDLNLATLQKLSMVGLTVAMRDSARIGVLGDTQFVIGAIAQATKFINYDHMDAMATEEMLTHFCSARAEEALTNHQASP